MGSLQGFSLVEVMVALVVLSVGMLGIAAMYGHGLAAARSAQTRTQALNLATDMADRIRANRLGQAAYAGAAANGQCDPQTGGGVDCTPVQLAAHDVLHWQQQVAAVLPAGDGTISYDGATLPPTYSIEVSWDEVGEGRLTHRLVIQLPTY